MIQDGEATMAGRLDGKVGLITGAASGIGRATALAFAREGARVMVSDVDEEKGAETVRLVEAIGGEAAFVRADVSDEAEVQAMVAATVRHFGGLDAAFNNAGIEGVMETTAEYPREAWDRVLAVNLTGVWLCMKAQIPVMLERGGGAIVNCASILGVVGFAGAPAYTASKHAVVGLTKVAALEYAPKGIRVNAVCPAFIETPMVMERGVKLGEQPEAYEQAAAMHPVGRLGKSEEIADAVVWLCSDGASFVHGHPLLVDGGFTAR